MFLPCSVGPVTGYAAEICTIFIEVSTIVISLNQNVPDGSLPLSSCMMELVTCSSDLLAGWDRRTKSYDAGSTGAAKRDTMPSEGFYISSMATTIPNGLNIACSWTTLGSFAMPDEPTSSRPCSRLPRYDWLTGFGSARLVEPEMPARELWITRFAF